MKKKKKKYCKKCDMMMESHPLWPALCKKCQTVLSKKTPSEQIKKRMKEIFL